MASARYEVHSAPLVTLSDAELTAGYRRRGNDYAASAVTVLGALPGHSRSRLRASQTDAGQRLKVFETSQLSTMQACRSASGKTEARSSMNFPHQQVLNSPGLYPGAAGRGRTGCNRRARRVLHRHDLSELTVSAKQTGSKD